MISKEDTEQIRAFIGNQAMLQAVSRVLMPAESFADGLPIQDDAEYGRSVRAWVGARELIKARFAELRRIASSNPQPQPKNEAR